MEIQGKFFLLIFMVSLCNTQCPIPNNCDTYSVSQQKCISCLSNYVLISNNCISVTSLSSLISNQQSTTTSTQSGATAFSNQQSPTSFTQTTITSSPIQTTQQQTAQSQSSFFVPWYSSTTNSAVQSTTQNQAVTSQPAQTLSYIFTNTLYGTYTDNNCKTKDISNSSCDQCYPSYYYNATEAKCIPVNPLCKKVNQQNQCTDCYSGYLLQNGNCVINPYGNSNSNGQSTTSQSQTIIVNPDGNCKKYTNNICSECYSGFYYNYTLGKCTVTNPNCKTVSNTNQCLSCYKGYTLNTQTGNCDILSQNITVAASSNSQSASSSTSSSSSSQSSSGTATSITQSVGSQFIIYNGFVYLISSQGQLVGPLDVASLSGQAIISNCVSYSNGQCVACANRYYLANNICKMVDPNCSNWTSSGVCTQCQSGLLAINGSCVQISSSSTSQNTQNNSQQQSQSACYPPRMLMINGVCVTVSDLCQTWSTITGICTTCYKGYTLNNGVCA